MTDSASTPRLRTTFAIYLALVGATAIAGPRALPASGYYIAGVAGFVCVALACLGRIWCSLFIAGHKDEKLITFGPYALCRHPLYSLSILGAFGLGLTSRSPLLCALVVVLVAGLVIYAASCEEQFLADSFPDEFKAYVVATPRKWWPRFAPRAVPDRVEVKPAIFWKALVDAGAFFLLYLLVALAADYRIGPIS
jgi:protein-S-isoprenylcysteine O-methyltransferase Ste14